MCKMRLCFVTETRTEVEAPDYSRLNEDGLPLSMMVELNAKKNFKDNAKLCFKQAPLHTTSSTFRFDGATKQKVIRDDPGLFSDVLAARPARLQRPLRSVRHF